MYDYTMDPLGDVVLTLRHPNSPFAEWEDDTTSDLHKPPQGEDGHPVAKDGTPAADESGHDDGKDGHPVAENANPAADRPVTFLVSSRHLILASPVLRAMLTGPWSEGSRQHGRHEIEAEDWDPQALAAVMAVLHGRCRDVPKEVTLEMLAKIAVIVDYYQASESFTLVAPMWIAPLHVPRRLPNLLCRDVLLWIVISWVFGDSEIFKHATKVATLRSQTGFEPPQDLAIPPAVIDRINRNRDESMAHIAASLLNLRQEYVDDRKGCDFECSAIHLGALLKNLRCLGIFERPLSTENPFPGLTLVDVVGSMSDLTRPFWFNDVSAYWHGIERTPDTYKYELHDCRKKNPLNGTEIGPEAFILRVGEKPVCLNQKMGPLNRAAATMVHQVKDKLVGLELSDFVGGTREGGRRRLGADGSGSNRGGQQ